MSKPDNTRDVQAAKVAEALRYAERVKPDSQWLRNWEYARYWRALNAARNTTPS
jgi:hypothetical protein